MLLNPEFNLQLFGTISSLWPNLSLPPPWNNLFTWLLQYFSGFPPPSPPYYIPFGFSALLLPPHVFYSFLSFLSHICFFVLRATPTQTLNVHVLSSSQTQEIPILRILILNSYNRVSGCPSYGPMLSPNNQQWTVARVTIRYLSQRTDTAVALVEWIFTGRSNLPQVVYSKPYPNWIVIWHFIKTWYSLF